MSRTKIELYAIKRGLTIKQAEAFAQNVLSKNSSINSHNDLEIILVPFAIAAGITLTGAIIVDNVLLGVPSAVVGTGVNIGSAVVGAGLEIGAGVVEIGFDVLDGIFGIFD